MEFRYSSIACRLGFPAALTEIKSYRYSRVQQHISQHGETISFPFDAHFYDGVFLRSEAFSKQRNKNKSVEEQRTIF
jgi:hypothetical protein